MIAVGGTHEATPQLNPQAMRFHHSSDPLMVHNVAALAQLACDAPVTVARELIMDFADQLDQRII